MTSDKSSRLLFLFHASDGAVIALLALAVAVATARLPFVGPPLVGLLLLHAGLLVGFSACTVIWMRGQERPWAAFLRPAVTIAVIFTLYTSLGKLGMAAMPYRADRMLAELDMLLCRVDPSLVLQRYQTPAWVEFFSFIYGAFIPYIYLSMVLGCLGRPPGEREQFLTGWVFTYVLSYLGYLLLPAHGPAVYHAADYDVALAGGFFYRTVLRGVEASGGLQGAFPSLHVGGSVYLCLFDLKTNRLRGLTYLPMVLLIYLATLFLRYHYVVDLIVGTVIAMACLSLSQYGLAGRARRQQATGRLRPGKRGVFYRLFRALARRALHVFFRRIEVEGREHVPARGPVLFVCNHTNALVDPLVLLATLERRLTVTAKNVLARNPLLRGLMAASGVVTFHRPEDVGKGADLRQNVRSFERCREVLAAEGALCIFPEGVSHSDPQLRRFHTGPARIALDYVGVDGNPGGLRIVPVGLLYTEKDRFRSGVWLRFGPALDAGQWAAAHPGAGIRELTAEMRRRVQALTLAYETRREAALVGWAAAVVATQGAMPLPLGRDEDAVAEGFRLQARLQAGYRVLRGRNAQEVEELARRLRRYRAALKRSGIDPGEVYLPRHFGKALLFAARELELLLVGAPLALFGLLNHGLPYATVKGIARALSRDKDHWASNAIYPGLLVFPLFCLVQLAAAWLALPAVWALAYTLALPYTGSYALLYTERAGRAWRRARTFLAFLAEPSCQERLAREGRDILAHIRALEAGLPASPTPDAKTGPFG